MLCWVTAPEVPWLPTRIETFVFWTPFCVASAVAPSAPEVSAAATAVLVWVTAPSSPGENTRTETFVFVDAVLCRDGVALSSTVPSPVAGGVTEVVAVAPAAFACSTVPLSPGLPTRTVTAVFCVSGCVAVAAAGRRLAAVDVLGA